MPQLCVEFASENDNIITSEIINKAEHFSFERFIKLVRHAENNVRRAASQLEQLN